MRPFLSRLRWSRAGSASIRCASSSTALPRHHSTTHLSGSKLHIPLALLILHVDFGLELGAELESTTFGHLWRSATMRLCADGAANRLHDSLSDAMRKQMLPDLIRGDLDSLRSDVEHFYSERGVRIEREPEQETHDFDKCLRWLLEQRRVPPSPPSPLAVVAYGSFGGRLDQTMANLNMLYRYESAFDSFVLLSDQSLAFLLPPGKNIIQPDRTIEVGSCGLIPLGGVCERVRTSGLKWNLSGEQLRFGDLVSSSNAFGEDTITVENNSPLLWTSNLKLKESGDLYCAPKP